MNNDKINNESLDNNTLENKKNNTSLNSNKKDENFSYTYTAPTKNEKKIVEDIRKRYQPVAQEKSEIEKLKKLDKKVNDTPTMVSLVLGIIGTLIFGTGMSMVLEFNLLIWGIVVSSFGLVPLILAYPVYKTIHSKLKKKYAQEILELSEKILNETEKD